MKEAKNTHATPNCNSCGCKLPPRTLYFCPPCWWNIPAKERAALNAMHSRKQDTVTKVQKCVRLLAARKEPTP